MTDLFLIVFDARAMVASDESLDILVNDLGQACRIMDRAWALRTERSADNVFTFLSIVTEGLHPAFLVAPLAGPWLPWDARSAQDCCGRGSTTGPV